MCVCVCVCVWFLPRDAMRNRGLCSDPVSVCLSVRHGGVLYPDGSRYRQTSFSALPNSKGTLQWGAQNIRGGGLDFRQKSPSIIETVRDRPMVAIER